VPSNAGASELAGHDAQVAKSLRSINKTMANISQIFILAVVPNWRDLLAFTAVSET